MRLDTLVLMAFAVLPVARIASQQAPRLKPGDRIRAQAPSASPGPLVGTVVAFQADSLMVQGDTKSWRLSLASITRLDISQGRRSRAGLGAGIGLLVGAGVGALIGSGCDAIVVPVSSEAGCVVVGAAVFGGAGALVGAVTGALMRTERWAEVPLDRLRVSFTSDRGRALTLGASLTF
jgi:hypothetical protein